MALRRCASTSPAGARADLAATFLSARAVAFDVDSTVIDEEGIDELAAFAGKGEAIKELTRRAMGGSMPFGEALQQRLELLQPTRQMLDAFLAAHPFRLTPGFDTLTAKLQARGTAVYLVSGGFTDMILPVARRLGVPRERVFANSLRFDAAGGYAGFDETAYTCRAGGKAAAVRAIKAASPGRIVMVGDGATDLEARCEGGADLFVGYGGVTVREAVRQGADWYVMSWEPLLSLLTEREVAQRAAAGHKEIE